METNIRKFHTEDAEQIAGILREVFLRENIRIYSHQETEQILEQFCKKSILELAGYTHIYVALQNKTPIGFSIISEYNEHTDKKTVMSIFISDIYNRQEVSGCLLHAMQKDPIYRCGKKIELLLSSSACEFYRKKTHYDISISA